MDTIKTLSENGIPVNAMLAPIIPAINSHEILPLAKAVSDSGALSMAYTLVRLNGAIGEVFEKWIHEAMPDRAQKVLNQITESHGGSWDDNRFRKRMVGEGKIAQQISDLVGLARKRYFSNKKMPELNCNIFAPSNTIQGTLF